MLAAFNASTSEPVSQYSADKTSETALSILATLGVPFGDSFEGFTEPGFDGDYATRLPFTSDYNA